MPETFADQHLPIADVRVQRACAWSGVVLLLVFMPAFIVLCHLWPPPDPTWTAAQVKAFFLEDTARKRIGIALCLASWALIVPWSVALASFTARAESGFRILSVIQVACGSGMAAIGELMMLLWGVNAFRPDVIPADTMRVLDDLGWFIFVMYWAPGTVWVWAAGTAILLDRHPRPALPRWAGYVCLWVGLSFFPAALALLFKTGPFAYNGLFGVWVPAGVFFVWFGLMTVLMLSAGRRNPRRSV